MLGAADDASWRVREAVAKVIARHQLDDGFDAIAHLERDPVERVRTAAGRARRRLSESGS